MEHIRIGREPILDKNLKLCAYALLYKEDIENKYASASLVSSVLNKFGRESLLGDKRAFVTIDEKFLMHDLILTIPNEFFIFSLASEIEISERVVERVQQLYAKKYKLCIEHLTCSEEILEKYEPILKQISFAKIDICQDERDYLQDIVRVLKEASITAVADNIYDAKQFEKAKILGCDLFQGYFFAEPKIVENAKYEATHLQVLQLYRLLMEDTNIDEITKEFENNYEITIQLLQFINSGAFHFRKKISSIHHVLVLVGRVPLAQWLMLMIYSKSVTKDITRSPLILMVKNRTELMEKILKTIEPTAGSNMLGEAYFVGVLSLIDTLFGMRMEDILEKIHISSDVENALLHRSGVLGEMLTLICEIEKFDTKAVTAFEKKYNLKEGLLNEIILSSIESVQEFEHPKELDE